jgi:hypothetical protein
MHLQAGPGSAVKCVHAGPLLELKTRSRYRPVSVCLFVHDNIKERHAQLLAYECFTSNELKSYIEVFLFVSGLTFKLRLEFPDGYPYTAPTVRFTSPCYHPNVDQVRTGYFLQ